MSFNKSIIIIYILFLFTKYYSSALILSLYLRFLFVFSPSSFFFILTSHNDDEKNVLDFTTSFFLLHSYFIKKIYIIISHCVFRKKDEFIFKTFLSHCPCLYFINIFHLVVGDTVTSYKRRNIFVRFFMFCFQGSSLCAVFVMKWHRLFNESRHTECD